MKNRYLHVLACFLCLVLLTAAFTACSSPDGPNVTPTVTPGENEADTPTASPTQDPNARFLCDLPEVRFDGTEYHVLEWSANGDETVGAYWIPWEEIDVPDYEGDIITLAVFNRNNTVEENYGVTITREFQSVDMEFSNVIRANNQTGDDAYALITFRSVNVPTYIQENLLLDLNEYDDILHFDSPWWVADSVDSFLLGSHLYLASGELLLRDKGATAVTYFNQKLTKDYELGNLYTLAESGDWTVEAMIEMCQNVYSDLDGSDVLDSSDDMWGAVGSVDLAFFLYCGAGQRFAHVDDSGHLQYDFGDEDSIALLKDIFDTVAYADWCTPTYLSSRQVNMKEDVFLTDKCLFKPGMVKHVTTELRNMESDYGILPIPKYSDLQDDYASLVYEHHDCILGVPACASDPIMNTVVLEALTWESYYTVYPKFYDTLIMDRSTRDEESKRMLKIVFDTRTYDPGQIWDFKTGFYDGGDSILNMTGTGSSNIASTWERFKNAVLTNVDKVNEWIDENE